MADPLENRVLSVKEITLKIKLKLESEEFSNISVSGEVSNCSMSQSGHLFFNLKETNKENNDTYLLKAVIWKSSFKYLKNQIKDGDKVICKGRINLYAQGGEYRLIVDSIELSGEGEFWKRFLQLKEKLEKEGLFESIRKKPIPKYPQKIGIITSENAAALQDIFNTIKSRAANIDIYLFPVLVQGETAADMIKNAIKLANEKYTGILDLIILARGGGSIEDLWPFNEEVVARAIAESKIPIISGIGHETDFTIADLVADYRAPTPTGAAAIVCQGYLNAKEFIAKSEARLKNNIFRILSYYTEKISLSQFEKRCKLILTNRLDNIKMRIDFDISKIISSFNSRFSDFKQRLLSSTKLLQNLSVQTILSKGYSITRKIDGTLIKNSKDLSDDEKIETILSKGRLISLVKEIKD
jgi:exodeoxyribonuclease VII large subunit